MLNLGLIGAGRIGKVHCESVSSMQDVRIKMLADPLMNEETENLFRAKGVEVFTKDYKEILADESIQAVLICSSTDTHAKISIEAAQAGKHIFCEKPVSKDIEEIKQVIAAVEKAGVKFQVGFNRRFDSNFKALHTAVSEGKIGKLEVIKITSRDPAPPSPEYAKSSGGMFADMTIHDFDMVRYLSGSEAVEVYAASAVLVDPEIGLAGDIDTAVITIKLANGALAVIDNSRRAAYGYDQRAEVFGSEGMAAVSNKTESSLVVSTQSAVTQEKPLYFFLERYMQSFTDEMKCFIAAVQTGKEVPVNAQDGLAPVLIVKAANLSVEKKRPVLLSEVTE